LELTIMAGGVKQERFLGALMGMAIGDAMGMPVAGWTAERIRERFGAIDGYYPRVFADGGEIKAGEFTDESELALCIVESFTVNDGELDPDNIGARFLYLGRGEAKRWMNADTLRTLAAAEATLDFTQPLDEDGPATGDVAARGIPIGLIHAVGPFDPVRMRADAELVTRVTHGSPAAIAAVTAVAHLVRSAARNETTPGEWAGAASEFVHSGETAAALNTVAVELSAVDFATRDDAASVVASAAAIALAAADFPSAVFDAVNYGGPSDARGAISGAIAGARWGISGIPQSMIDDLEGRIYVSLAVPWFYRTALKRAGLVMNLRLE
jgi:ADP-ribosyl-[dinitrogen reductase] hydrolase